MKRKNYFFLLVLFLSNYSLFGLEKIATTYQTKLTPMDMVEIFVEELNKGNYVYQIGDYQVYTEEDSQNYAWSVQIDTEGYEYNNSKGHGTVAERSVYLFMKNGWVALKTFGGPTQTNRKSCLNANDKEQMEEISNSLGLAITDYRENGSKWLKRYGSKFSKEELLALDYLSNLEFTEWLGWVTVGLSYAGFSWNFSKNEISEVEKYYEYKESSSQNEEIIQLAERHDLQNLKMEWFSENISKYPSLTELKNLKKEGKNIYCSSSTSIIYFKIISGRLYQFTSYKNQFVDIDTLIEKNGDWTKLKMTDYQYGYFDKDGNYLGK